MGMSLDSRPDNGRYGAAGAASAPCPDVALLCERAAHVFPRTAAADFGTDDPVQASDRLIAVYSPHRLRLLGERSDFRMRLRMEKLGALTLSSLSFNTEVELAQEPAGSFVLVTTQLRGSSDIFTARESRGGGAGLVVVDSATRQVVKRFSADSERLNVHIDQQALGALCAQLLGRTLDRPLEFNPIIRTDCVAHRRWLCMARMLLDYAAAPPALPLAARVHRQLEEMAMLMLLTEHEHSYSERLKAPAPAIAPRHIKAAEEFILARAADSLTLAEIAGAVGVSIRTLSAGFQTYRETTPMKHLRDIRLNAARQDLLAGESGRSVSDVAMRWGFGNLGRFAGDYRRRFGEYPSDTLLRCS